MRRLRSLLIIYTLPLGNSVAAPGATLTSYIRVVVLPRPLFPTRFYLLHPWSRALLSALASCFALPRPSLGSHLLHLTAMDGGNAIGLQEQSLPCASRHLHIHVQWRECNRIVGRSCASLRPRH